MERKLAFRNSEIMTYVYEAYPLGIMEANGNEYKEWMYSNYVQLNSHKDIIKNREVFLAFYDEIGIKSPFLKIEKLCWSLLINYHIDYVDFFKKNIDLGCYLYFKVDEYYLPNRYLYQKKHFIHDNMIIGYDNENFIVVGYDDKGICRETKVKCDVFIRALYGNEPDIEKKEWKDDIYFIKYVKADYKFNINAVKFYLYDYLNSINRIEQCNRFSNPLSDTVYGLDVYEKVIEYITYLKEKGNIFRGLGTIDNRVFRIIMEHKKIMLQRIEYMNRVYGGLDDIYSIYYSVNQSAKFVHNMAIKYRIKKDNDILGVLIDKISELKNNDEKILGELYMKIERIS